MYVYVCWNNVYPRVSSLDNNKMGHCDDIRERTLIAKQNIEIEPSIQLKKYERLNYNNLDCHSEN